MLTGEAEMLSCAKFRHFSVIKGVVWILTIYKITCLVNQKVYVGQTSEALEKRFARHMGYQKEELDQKEKYYIDLFDSVKSGYNTKDSMGKCGGDTLSEHENIKEIREKIRQSKLGDKNPMRIYGGLYGARNGMYGKNGKENPFAKRCKAVSIDGSDTKYFDTLTELKEFFNVTTLSMVTLRCQGKTKSPYKGYYFKYCEDDEKS